MLLLMLTHPSKAKCGRGPKMTAVYAGDRGDPGAEPEGRRRTSRGSRGDLRGGHRRHRRRSRPTMVLLDYPDSEGVTRELAIGYPRRLVTSRPLLALGVAAVLALCAVLAGRTVLLSAA